MDLQKIGIALFIMLWSQILNIQWRIIQTRRATESRSRRRWWVRPVNKRRFDQGFNLNLFRELRISDHEEFFGYTRMWPEQFEFLLSLVHPLLEKHSMRAPLSPRLRLSLTLTYLAQGESMRTKHLEFRVGKSTVCKIIPEVCRAIWLVLQPVVLPTLDADGWKRISEQYMLKWQFPNCIGALDGRHMEIEKPPCSGSQYHNYKRFFSMVLLALCDANHKLPGWTLDSLVRSVTVVCGEILNWLQTLPPVTLIFQHQHLCQGEMSPFHIIALPIGSMLRMRLGLFMTVGGGLLALVHFSKSWVELELIEVAQSGKACAIT
ncbi:uncharacterized protein LOC143904723 [Temnothorax americanus]|uniref:uncharacterized protein LOC143904723 n=1 Tax=Temnothorax americanus TaxID=1964332 RepID=UPI00406880DE